MGAGVVGAPLTEGEQEGGAQAEPDEGAFEGGVFVGLGFEAEGAMRCLIRHYPLAFMLEVDVRWGSATATGQIMLNGRQISEVLEWETGHDPYGEGDEGCDEGYDRRVPGSFVPAVEDVEPKDNTDGPRGGDIPKQADGEMHLLIALYVEHTSVAGQ